MKCNHKGRNAIITGRLTKQELAIASEGSDINVGFRGASAPRSDAAVNPDPEHIAGIRKRLSAFANAVHIGYLAFRNVDEIEQFANTAESVDGPFCLARCVTLDGDPDGFTCGMNRSTWAETGLMRKNARELVEREGKVRTTEDAISPIAGRDQRNRLTQSHEVTAHVTFLCGAGASGITMENIQITGGLSGEPPLVPKCIQAETKKGTRQC